MAFLETVGLYPPGSVVELCSGQIAIVVEANPKYRHLPTISIILDADKKRLDKPQFFSLSMVETDGLSKEYLVRKVHRDGSFGISLRDFQDQGLLKHIAS